MCMHTCSTSASQAGAICQTWQAARGSCPHASVRTHIGEAQHVALAICVRVSAKERVACRFNFIRAQTPAPLDSAEALASSAVQMALDMKAKAIVCFTASGRAAPLLSKYRPTMPVLVVSGDQSVVRASRAQFGLHGVPMQFDGLEVRCPTS